MRPRLHVYAALKKQVQAVVSDMTMNACFIANHAMHTCIRTCIYKYSFHAFTCMLQYGQSVKTIVNCWTYSQLNIISLK